ncbi:MAG: hypothetical protein SGJ04_02215 [Bacteroidota bacterium]|nr:hypothetical protein [Bacteroidota bacterium]
MTVNELRKAGKVDEAEQLAKDLLAESPGNQEILVEYAWIIHTRAKKEVEKTDPGLLGNRMREIRALGLNLDEQLSLGNAFGWLVHKAIKVLADKDNKRFREVFDLLDEIMYFSFDMEANPNPYSFLLRAAFKVKEQYNRIDEFIDWWGLENLQPDDFQPFVFNDKPLMSTAEQAYVTYTRAILERDETELAEGKLETWQTQLSELIDAYPEMVQPLYCRARVNLRLGNFHNVVDDMSIFVRSKPEFWAWGTLGDAQAFINPDQAMACYGKALLANTYPDNLLPIKERFMELCIHKKDYNVAATELTEILEIYKEIQRPVSEELETLTDTDWFKTAYINKHNKRAYGAYAAMTDDIMFAHLPWEVGLITDIDIAKGLVRFIIDRSKSGTFKHKKAPHGLKIGDTVRIRLEPQDADTGVWYKVQQVELTEESPSIDIYKAYDGILMVRDPNRFGFINGEIFVVEQLFTRMQVNHRVYGTAVASYNAKKDAWGWKAITLQKA